MLGASVPDSRMAERAHVMHNEHMFFITLLLMFVCVMLAWGGAPGWCLLALIGCAMGCAFQDV